MITAERVRELFDYDPNTGLFLRRIAIGYRGRWRKGNHPGTDNGNGGYIRMLVDGQKCYAHRLAWLYIFGYLPSELDHIDGDPTNNRISNLRPATRTQNNANTRKPKTNTSGLKGVGWVKRNKNWRAVISINNKSVHLGTFLTAEEAHAAYLAAARRYHGEFMHP